MGMGSLSPATVLELVTHNFDPKGRPPYSRAVAWHVRPQGLLHVLVLARTRTLVWQGWGELEETKNGNKNRPAVAWAGESLSELEAWLYLAPQAIGPFYLN